MQNACAGSGRARRTVRRCSRCDGRHEDADCPHFRGARGAHADARPLPEAERPLPGVVEAPVRWQGTRIAQPRDGSCLFHALIASVALVGSKLASGISTAASLRRVLLKWLETHSTTEYAGWAFLEMQPRS